MDFTPRVVKPVPNIREWVHEAADEADYEVIVLDGWDHAILGLVKTLDGETHVVYDEVAILQGLVAEGLSYEDSKEYFDFNIVGLSPMVGGPLFLQRPERPLVPLKGGVRA